MVRAKVLLGVAAVSMTGLFAGCGGDDSPPSGDGGPVTIEWWGWNQGQEAQAELFNKTHDDVKVKYVQQAGNPETAQALQQAAKAGGEAACLAQSPDQLAPQVVDDLIQPITSDIEDDADAFDPAAYESMTLGDEVYGIPFNANPTFMLIDKAVYDKHGLAAPTTWDELIAQGKELAPKGISVFNLAGEDPSTLTNLAWQAGAQWFSIDGDSWKVDFTSAESKEAGAVVQQLVDNDLASHETYAQWDALMQKFDSGTMINIPTSTWQLAAYAQNFQKSLGDWEAVPLPTFDGTPATPGGYNAYIVPTGCEHVEAGVELGVWLATDPDAITLAADPKTGAGIFPAVPDTTPYVDILMDKTMLGENADTADQVVEDAVESTVQDWTYGPNWTAVQAQLVDEWAKVLDKKQSVDQLLENMQTFAVDDLEKRGISVTS
jgi:multiple sugar transport system substrate-binding protein